MPVKVKNRNPDMPKKQIVVSGRGGLEVERQLHIQLKVVTSASAGSNLLLGTSSIVQIFLS